MKKKEIKTFETETRKPEDSLQNPLALSKVVNATKHLKRSHIIAKPPPNSQEPRATRLKILQHGGVL